MDPQPAPSAESAAARASAWSAEALRAEAECNLTVLKELRGLVLEATRAIQRQLVDPEAPKVVEGDVMLALNRAARALRLTCNLQDRLIKEALSPDGAAAQPMQTHVKVSFVDGPTGELVDNARDARAWTAAGQAERAAFRAAKGQALGVVRGVAAATLLPGELSPREETEAVDRMEREAAERFEGLERDREREFTQLMRRPFSEIVAQICRDIGLVPNWEVLAGEAWAADEIESGRVGAPLAPFRPPNSPLSPAEAGAQADAPDRTRLRPGPS